MSDEVSVDAQDGGRQGGGGQGRPRSVDEIRAEVADRGQWRPGLRAVRWPPDLIADLWRLPEAEPALAQGQVTGIFVFLQQMGVSQRCIARLTGTKSQSEISEIKGGRTVRSVVVLARIAQGLGLPPGVLGLAPSTQDTVAGPSIGERVQVDGVSGAADVVATSVAGAGAGGDGSAGRHCASCLCAPAAAPLVGTRHSMAVGPAYWTGVELRGLRLCLRLSVPEFAYLMAVGERAVYKWEAGGGRMVPRRDTQAGADMVLRRADPTQRARFGGWLVQSRDRRGQAHGDADQAAA